MIFPVFRSLGFSGTSIHELSAVAVVHVVGGQENTHSLAILPATRVGHSSLEVSHTPFYAAGPLHVPVHIYFSNL